MRDKGPVPNLSLVERLDCIRDKNPSPACPALVERLHCMRPRTCPQLECIRDKEPTPNLILSLVERLHCIMDKMINFLIQL